MVKINKCVCCSQIKKMLSYKRKNMIYYKNICSKCFYNKYLSQKETCEECGSLYSKRGMYYHRLNFVCGGLAR